MYLNRLSLLGTRILNVGDVPKEQLYPMRLKGVAICFSTLKAALSGNYVNFGVFRLYGDRALDDALSTFVKLLLSISQSDLLVSATPYLTHHASSRHLIACVGSPFLGLPEVESELLRAVGMPCAGSHEFRIAARTSSLPLHSQYHLRRPQRAR